jgi:hypothetical protein
MKTLLFIIQILPSLIDALKAIEAVWPAAGKGSDKLAMLKELLEKAYPAVTEYWPAIEQAVAVLVSWFNKTGVFKKG